MAITGVTSYPPTAEEFENHWEAVNAAQPANPLVLPDGTTLAIFRTSVAAMNAAFGTIVPASSLEREAAAAIRLGRSALQPRFVQFGQSVRLYLTRTRFADAAPKSPNATEGKPAFSLAGEQVAARWADIDAATDLAPFSPPLVLPNLSDVGGAGYALADFNTEVSALLAAFSADVKASGDATQKRRDRDALLPTVYAMMKAYRETVLLILPKNSPFRATLPRLTPAPGTTPPAIVYAGAWDNAILMARLTWPQLSPAVIEKYGINRIQARGCAGTTYKAADEEIIPGGEALSVDTTHFETDFALTAPGSMASIKIYAMCDTGNENGGKAVKIVRPVT